LSGKLVLWARKNPLYPVKIIACGKIIIGNKRFAGNLWPNAFVTF
jgi:hypothetical protein